jgi:hypothetical protein
VTVTNDAVIDHLKGGNGTDWFIASASDTFDRKDLEQVLLV